VGFSTALGSGKVVGAADLTEGVTVIGLLGFREIVGELVAAVTCSAAGLNETFGACVEPWLGILLTVGASVGITEPMGFKLVVGELDSGTLGFKDTVGD
jgi:hypothetical protein